ncbi:MAG: hypothetical protein ACLRZ9_05930 [Eubacterium sp.]
MNEKITGDFEDLVNSKETKDEYIDIELKNTHNIIVEMVKKINDKQILRYIYKIISDIMKEV